MSETYHNQHKTVKELAHATGTGGLNAKEAIAHQKSARRFENKSTPRSKALAKGKAMRGMEEAMDKKNPGSKFYKHLHK